MSQIKFALFDFDGTLSLLRNGWQEVMATVMKKNIIGGTEISLDEKVFIQKEVDQYIEMSTGLLTIKQMKWLEEAVRRYGLNKNVMSAGEYKKIYSDDLLEIVSERVKNLRERPELTTQYLVPGAKQFLEELNRREIKLFLASGTDYDFVVQEANLLGVRQFFGVHIYGAHGISETDAKEEVIARLMTENNLVGEDLLVCGDGPVEIKAGASVLAKTIGIAGSENSPGQIDEQKKARLLLAGAQLIVPDLSNLSLLLKEISCVS